MHLQFKDEDHLIFIFICVVKVDQLVVMQVVHDVNLFPVAIKRGEIYGLSTIRMRSPTTIFKLNSTLSVTMGKDVLIQLAIICIHKAK